MKQTNGSKVIQTRYQGVLFRSRLEARWAVFFDSLGIEWEYEKEGYNLGDGLCYLPDFWLPQVNMWAEVKPEMFLDIEKEKATKLCLQTTFPVLLLIGVPEDKPYFAIELSSMNIGKTTESEYCLTMYHRYPVEEGRFYCSPCGEDDSHHEDTALASISAKSARFERWDND